MYSSNHLMLAGVLTCTTLLWLVGYNYNYTTVRLPHNYTKKRRMRVHHNDSDSDPHPQMPFNKPSITDVSSGKESQSLCYRQVHIWTNEYKWGQGEFPCPGLPCGIRQVQDTSYKTMQKSDAVVLFHLTLWDWTKMHQHRPPGQKWVFCSHESPINTKRDIIPPKKYYTNSYDYIMSFRHHEGNLFGDFGKFDRSKPSISVNDSQNWAENKTKVAIWVAKNCVGDYLKWKRTEFVRALSKLVSVDMYGPCGNAECPRNTECSQIFRQHKFYLAFENCNCRNYITEKLWSNSYLHGLVPVVYGPPREDYEAVAPPNSFIYVKDFNSIQDLAEYLHLLDRNDHLYNKYFEWKKIGSVESIEEGQLFHPSRMCQVVERLLADEKAVADGTYKPIKPPDWESWWYGSCHNDKDFPIRMN